MTDIARRTLTHPATSSAIGVLALLVLLTGIVGVSTVPASAQTSGLVAAYGFSEGAGPTVADGSGNNNTGTLGSGVTWTTQGRYGSALVFNGAGFVTIPAAAGLNLTTGMTLQAWVYPTVASSAWSTAVMKEQAGEFVYVLYAGSPVNRPSLQFNVGTTASGERSVTGPAGLTVNTWTHLAGTYDGTTVRLYVNGAQVASQAGSGAIATASGGLRVGGNSVGGGDFPGRLDEVRIYNRALTAAEIQADMNTPPRSTAPGDT